MPDPDAISNEKPLRAAGFSAGCATSAPETAAIGAGQVPMVLQQVPSCSGVELGPTLLPAGPGESGDAFAATAKVNNRYQLKRLVGRGGYATVYEAWDELLHRTVAIKVPRRERFVSKRQLEAFLT